MYHEKGEHGLEQNPKAARRYYRQAAKQGEKRANYNLGIMYLNGAGMPEGPNPRAAAKQFLAGAEAGDIKSMYSIGTCFRDATGVVQNNEVDIQFVHHYIPTIFFF